MNSERGIYTVFTAISLVALLFVVGLAIDSGKLELDKTRLQRSSDAGAIVAGSRIGDISTSDVETLGELVAQDNMDIHGLTYNAGDIQATVTNDTEVTVNSKTNSETFFIGKVVSGQPDWDLNTVAAAHKRPVAVVMVVDVSGSMNKTAQGDYQCYEACSPNSRLDVLKSAAKTFVNNFDEEKDAFSIVTFNSGVSVEYPMAHPFSQEDVSNTIDGLFAGGWTNTHGGLAEGRNQLNQLPLVVGAGYEAYKKVIVLITDGAPNRHVGDMSQYPSGCSSYQNREHLVWPVIEADLARQEGAVIFGVGVGQLDPNTSNAFQTQPTDSGAGIYYLKNFMFRRVVNDQANGLSDPQFPSECFNGYGSISGEPQGEYLESPDDYDIMYMLNQVSLSIKMKLTK